jgi:hypothetical protein
VTRLSFTEAVRLVFAGPSASLETAKGDSIVLQATGTKGTRVWATAPRLQVAQGMTLRARLVSPHDQRPWIVTFETEDARFHTDELAQLRLRAVSVDVDETRRRNVRVPAGGVASLTAVNCLDVVDGDRVDGTIVDLSHDGLAFATTRVLRTGDRLILRARFFTQQLHAEVRVTSTRPGSAGHLIAGCRFIHIDAANHAHVDALIAAASATPHHNQHPLDLNTLRKAATNTETPPQRRRLFKRN